MVKRIIFDLDDTLIPWKNSYFNKFFPTLKKYDVIENKKDIFKLSNAIDEYEKIYSRYNDESFISLIDKAMNKKIPKDFYDELKEFFTTCIPDEIDKEVIEVLEYLNKKYELVVLTNFFEELQNKRLENYGIKKYFIDVIGGDKYIKPYKESYLLACGSNNPNECVMIGDNYQNDVEGALQNGLQAIYLNLKNKEVNKEIISISNLIELKNIL